MKNTVCTVLGAVGGLIAAAVGGCDAALITLIIFMSVDFISGLVVAGVFHNSSKSATGALESKAGWKGLSRKCMTMFFVLIAHRLDLMLGIEYVRSAVIIGFASNELISIVENAGLMGIPLPDAVTRAVDMLKKKSSEE